MIDEMELAREAVAKGMAWLLSAEAEEYGVDLDRVDLEALTMYEAPWCVLGQASGHQYWPTLERKFGVDARCDVVTDIWTRAHGFLEDSVVHYYHLEVAWVEAINAHRAEQAS